MTILLRALAAADDGLPPSLSPIKTGDDDEIMKLFADIDTDETHQYIETCFKNEPTWELKKKQTLAEAALIEFYRRMRPGDPPTLDNAREYLQSQLFDQRRYDLERVGRYKLNQRLGLQGIIDPSHRTIAKADLVRLVRQMIIINNGERQRDDIDHLGNRRVKTVGELVGNKLRIGLRRMERVVKERMSIRDAENLTPVSLVNIRPIVAAVREFFGSSQLSQFMEQTNPLSELTHKRTLSALGPGGLRRERAGFYVRDVHHSHYGRICPIETPEGPNIGLIGRLASYARVNELGFIETPYRKVLNELPVQIEEVETRPASAKVLREIEKSLDIEPDLLDKRLAKQVELVSTTTVPVSKSEMKQRKIKQELLGRKLARDVEVEFTLADVVRAGIDGEVSLSEDSICIEDWAERQVNVPADYKVLVKPDERVKAGEHLAIPPDGRDMILYLLDRLSNEEVWSLTRLILLLHESVQMGEANPFHFYPRSFDKNQEKNGYEEDGYEEYIYEEGDERLLSNEVLWSEDVRYFADKLNNEGLVEKTKNESKRYPGRPVYHYKLTTRGQKTFDSSAFEADYPQVAKAIQKAIIDVGYEKQVRVEHKSRDLAKKINDVVVARRESKILAVGAKSLSLIELQGKEEHRRERHWETFVAEGVQVQSGKLLAGRIAAVDGKEVATAEKVAAVNGKEIATDGKEAPAAKQKHIIPADSVIDAKTLELLQESARHLVPVYVQVPNEDLLGCELAANNTVIDKSALQKLVKDKVAEVEIVLRQNIEAGTVIDAAIFELLADSDCESVAVLDKAPNKGLLERTLYADVIDQDERVVGKKGAIIDEELLEKFALLNIDAVSLSAETGRLVDNPMLIGRAVRDDVEDAEENLILEEDTIIDEAAQKKLKEAGIKTVPVQPFATREIEYLSADNEDKFIIAQANARLDERDQFISNRVSSRYNQKFVSERPTRINYMDVAPRQIVGISAALIPFLSHDAANRALMGSNMQRQAVPLLTPDVSVVSTGMEGQAAFDSGQVLVSDIHAEVISVQGHRVIVRATEDGKEHVFLLRKYERSNQSTCIDQRPLVRKGDMIEPGDVIADSSSTFDGQLALGHDVLTCFLSWDGGNYEDALLVSEDMLRNDKFTSIHIEKHEIEARDTKLGAEEITYDIPNVGEEALKDLDEHGIVRIGAEVGPNDILVGKITPKGEKELSPEEKLLRAIFGEQAREVKDSSLRLPHGGRGKVIDVKVFTREEHPDLPAGVEKMVRVSVAQRRKLTVGDKMAGRHGNKGVISKIVTVEDMPYINGGIPVEIILNPLGVPSRMNIGQILELHLGWAADRLGFRAITPVFDGVKEQEIQAELGRAWLIDWAWKLTTERAWQKQAQLAKGAGIGLEDFDDDTHVICAYLIDLVGDSGLYDNDAIILQRDPIYVRRVAVAEVLREFGHGPDEIMVYDNSDLPAEMRDRRDKKALDLSVRLWIEQTGAGEIDLPATLSTRELFAIAEQLMFKTGQPVPHYGKMTLYDGRTGEPFDRPVAVGYVHMLKLAHLVEDKAHARSTGPYSLVTQQPLGGKAQFGGQRFGEMEVWALEAYGAAHILQEMLTVKSDDVQGRVKTYESIVKGEPIEEPGIPTSFRVLVKELQSLGLSVEAITGTGDVIRFGKYDEQQFRRAQPETGLLGLGAG